MKKQQHDMRWVRGFATAAASINSVTANVDDALVVAVVKGNGLTIDDIKAGADDGDYEVIAEAFESVRRQRGQDENQND